MSLHIETVTNALTHHRVNSLPQGELFISREFLDHYFPGDEGRYVKQLDEAARCLGLSVIGIWLDTEWSDSLLSELKYNDLGHYFTVGCISGPISSLVERHGFFDAMSSMRKDPSLLAGIAAKLLRDTERKAGLAHANGFRAMTIADDIAGNNGLIFSPGCFVDMVWPVYKEMAEIVKGKGLSAFFHSDGDTRKIIEFLIEAGYDCIHPVDTQAGQNLYEWKKEFGERVSFMGHIDTMTWNEDRMNKEINLAEHEFKNGGLILGSTCGISIETVNDQLGVLYPRWEKRGPLV